MDEVELCELIRGVLANVTQNFKWGLICGRRFGHEFDLNDPNCQLAAEYKFRFKGPQDATRKVVHIFIYNKDGYIGLTPAPTTLPKQIRALRRTTLSGSFFKALCFCMMAGAVMWISSLCRSHNPDSDSRAPLLSMATLCKYKTPLFWVLAIFIVVLYSAALVFYRIRTIRAAIPRPKTD